MRTLLLLLIALLPVACEVGRHSRVEMPSDSTGEEIPFRLAGPGDAAIIVPVYINGKGPQHFVLDTGATLTCVNESLADTLDLPEKRGQIGFGATVTGAGRMRLVGIDSLRVGKVKAHDMTACTLDLDHFNRAGLRVDGLLGLNFLKSFRVTLDFESEQLQLEKP